MKNNVKRNQRYEDQNKKAFIYDIGHLHEHKRLLMRTTHCKTDRVLVGGGSKVLCQALVKSGIGEYFGREKTCWTRPYERKAKKLRQWIIKRSEDSNWGSN